MATFFASAVILKSFKFGQRLEFIHFRLILQTCQVKEVTSFKKGWENEIQNTFKLHNGQKYIFTLLFFGCFETRWNSLKKEVVCIVIVKRKNGKWKCKLSFDGLGLLKYGLLFPRSFSKLSFVTEAARTAAQANCQRRKLERQFSTWKSSPLRIFKKTRWCSQNYIRGISSLRSFLCSFSSTPLYPFTNFKFIQWMWMNENEELYIQNCKKTPTLLRWF